MNPFALLNDFTIREAACWIAGVSQITPKTRMAITALERTLRESFPPTVTTEDRYNSITRQSSQQKQKIDQRISRADFIQWCEDHDINPPLAEAGTASATVPNRAQPAVYAIMKSLWVLCYGAPPSFENETELQKELCIFQTEAGVKQCQLPADDRTLESHLRKAFGVPPRKSAYLRDK